MEAVPQVSVVVATRNRARRLEAALGALAGQTLDPRSFEVIVVDDGSTDATPALLARRREDGLHLRALRTGGDGPAIARNAGWRVARGALVAFTDDDCEPAPEWLESMTRAAEAWPGAILQGPTEPMPAERDRLGRPFTRTRSIDGPNGWFATCNIAYPRELLERLGGFDERFPEPMGEDTDLGWRALELGARLEFVRRAAVHHAIEDLGPIGYLRDALRGAEGVYAFRRHPGLRARTLRHGVFRNPSLERLALALGALAGARLHPAMALLAIPYARDLGGRSRSSGGILFAPYLFVHDLLQAYSSLRGSIRHRILVL